MSDCHDALHARSHEYSRDALTGHDAVDGQHSKQALRSDWVYMPSRLDADANGAVHYALTLRLSPEGLVALSLQLYRGRDVVHNQSLGLVERHQVADVLFKCRMHLDRQGVRRLSAPEAGRSRPTPAETLKVKR